MLAGESIVLVSHVSAVHEGFIHQSSASTPDGTGFQLQLSTEKNKIGWKLAVQDSKIMKKKTLLEVLPLTSISSGPPTVIPRDDVTEFWWLVLAVRQKVSALLPGRLG